MWKLKEQNKSKTRKGPGSRGGTLANCRGLEEERTGAEGWMP